MNWREIVQIEEEHKTVAMWFIRRHLIAYLLLENFRNDQHGKTKCFDI